MDKFVFESNDLIQIALASYLTTGVLLASVGPTGKAISDEVRRVSNPLTYAFNNQSPPSETKIFLLRFLLMLGMTLLWSILIWGFLKEHRLQLEIKKNRIEKSSGLWFQHMGGSGSIQCRDCQHTEKVTSFIHGIDSSHSGFQCQECGLLTSLTGGGPGRANLYKESLECICGGHYEREKRLFCPHCKSENLAYSMEFIT